MAHLKWLLLGGGLVLATVLLFALKGRSKVAEALLDRLRLSERESKQRLLEARVRDARLRARQSESLVVAQKAAAKAEKAQKEATAIEAETRTLVRKISEEMSDDERAARFRQRHNLSDPRGGGG